MSAVALDAFDALAGWATHRPDGTSPSPALTLAVDTARFWPGAGAASLRLTAAAPCLGHFIQRSFAAVDCSALDELSLWWTASRPADGAPQQPFFVELRLGSAAMPIDAPGNAWRRYLPLARPNEWELLRLSLDDLPAPARGALSTLQLRCVDAAPQAAFTAYFDSLLAVREQMLTDLETALLARLHHRLTLDGSPVPAIFYHPEAPPAQALPFIQIRQAHVSYAGERRAAGAAWRSDYTAAGYRLRPAAPPYDVFYLLDGFAATRAAKTQIIDFLLAALPPGARLTVNNRLLAVEWVELRPFDAEGGLHRDSAALVFKVTTRQESGVTAAARPVTTLVVAAEPQSSEA